MRSQALTTHGEFGPLDAAKQAGNSCIAGIPASGNADQAVQWRQTGGVKNEPIKDKFDE